MAILDLCRTDVVTCRAHESVFAAAMAMTSRNVGTVVVTDEQNHPLGVVTDRDLVTKVIADSLDPKNTHLHEVMDRAVITVTADESIGAVLQTMADRCVRRLPVIRDKGGPLVGIIALDDMLRVLGTEMQAVTKVIEGESGATPSR